MPRDAKRPENRQRRNLPAILDGTGASPAGSGAIRRPSGLSAANRRAWDGLWASPVAQLLDPVSDLPAVTRLFRLYELGDEMDRRLANPPTGEGAPSVESMVTTRVRVAGECRILEGQLGLSPRSRLALGLALLAGKKAGGASLDQLVDEANDE
jgi:hypothetical protein